MRKLLKSTIGAMAVGLGMMMVVGCQNPTMNPGVPGGNPDNSQPEIPTYTVVYDLGLDNYDYSSGLINFQIENGKTVTKSLKLDKNNVPKDPNGIAVANWCGKEFDESEKTVTLTAEWKLNPVLEYKKNNRNGFSSVTIYREENKIGGSGIDKKGEIENEWCCYKYEFEIPESLDSTGDTSKPIGDNVFEVTSITKSTQE